MALALLLLFSCGKQGPDARLGELTGYATHPFASIKAFDVSGAQGRWVDGIVDDEARTVDFRFHSLANFKNVLIKVVMEENWASMVYPDTLVFRADISSTYKITINDGVDNINYSLTGREYPLIDGINITFANGETVPCSIDGLNAFARPSSYLWSTLKNVRVDVTLAEDATMVSSSSPLTSVDFSKGANLSIVCKDNINGKQRTYTVSSLPTDVATLTEEWTDLTHQDPWTTVSLSDGARIYKNTKLYGYNGNVGYLYTLPAGHIKMKVLDKWANMGGNSNISTAVRDNRDYSLFIAAQGPQVWRLSQSGANTYYSPLAYGADGSGNIRALRAEGFGGTRDNQMFAPAIALQDGKVSIRPAATKADNQLYHYSGFTGQSETLWTGVTAAFGGMFQLVKDGTMLVASEGDSYYQEYNEFCRRYTTMYQNLNAAWSYKPITDWDKLRTGRVIIGCTTKGDLIVLAVEKFVNTHNQGQDADAGLNGDTDMDRRGLNFYEACKVMSDLGCSDAMIVEDLNWTFAVFQDGGSRGLDVFKTNSRFDFQTEGSPMKAESAEVTNLAIVCFK
ncbi:MAG: hypothetical protein IJU13_01685 [Bacteroidales bacterium]|nr:hypothetical protein [Bacteroidales bacterium]